MTATYNKVFILDNRRYSCWKMIKACWGRLAKPSKEIETTATASAFGFNFEASIVELLQVRLEQIGNWR